MTDPVLDELRSFAGEHVAPQIRTKPRLSPRRRGLIGASVVVGSALAVAASVSAVSVLAPPSPRVESQVVAITSPGSSCTTMSGQRDYATGKGAAASPELAIRETQAIGAEDTLTLVEDSDGIVMIDRTDAEGRWIATYEVSQFGEDRWVVSGIDQCLSSLPSS